MEGPIPEVQVAPFESPKNRHSTSPPRQRAASPSCWIHLIFILGMSFFFSSVATGDWRETFETPQPSWRLVDRDAHSMQVRDHLRTFQQAHSGRGSEYLRIQAEFGTFIHYGHPIPAAPIIDELAITVWIKSNRPGIQLLASVALPRTVSPRDGNPLRTVLRGSTYEDVGTWQQLVILNPHRQLKQQEASLRRQFGPQVDIREAYVDLVVTNVFGGKGETEIWLDDLELTGYVITSTSSSVPSSTSSNSLGNIDDSSLSRGPAAGPGSPSRSRAIPLRVFGSQFQAGERPIFLRIIEHHGESFAWLRSLGFNCLHLARPPTPEEIQWAHDLQLWLIAPAPQHLDASLPETDGALVAWNLGERVGSDQLRSLHERSIQLRQSGGKEGPLVTSLPKEDVSSYRRLMDFTLLGLPSLGSSHELSRFPLQFNRQLKSGGHHTPVIASIQSDPAQALQLQWQALGYGITSRTPIEPEQLRLLVYHALGAGVRGIYFRSLTRLDLEDDATLLRARMLELLNAELQILDPWLAGGRATGEVEVGNPRIQGYSLETQRAQLLLFCRTHAEQQYAVAPYVDEPLELTVPALSSSPSVYQITSAGLVRLRTDRIAGGIRIKIDRLGITGAILITQENLVIDHLARASSEGKPRRGRLQVDIHRMAFEHLDRVCVQRTGDVDAADQSQMRDASALIERAEQLTQGSDFRSAEQVLDQAALQLMRIRYGWWERAARGFISPAASPFSASFAALPYHWDLASRAEGRSWSANSLAAGDMEDIRHIVDSGWERVLADPERATSQVELSLDSPQNGRGCLVLRLNPAPNTAPSDTPPPRVLLSSAPVPVPAGRLVQIRGWVRLPRRLTAESDGLMIYDSLGGMELAERIYSTNEGWREFTLYRAAPAHHELVVHFALTTGGTAMLDEVSVRTLSLDEGPVSSRLPAPENRRYSHVAARTFSIPHITLLTSGN
jgi:hypothetical protein